jgi:hypothetical protein
LGSTFNITRSSHRHLIHFSSSLVPFHWGYPTCFLHW